MSSICMKFGSFLFYFVFQLRETGKFKVRFSTKVSLTNFFLNTRDFFPKLTISWYWWDSGGLKDVCVHRARMGSSEYRLATLSMRISFNVCCCGVKGSVRWTARALNECVCL
jgi:hypothetical protein